MIVASCATRLEKIRYRIGVLFSMQFVVTRIKPSHSVASRRLAQVMSVP